MWPVSQILQCTAGKNPSVYLNEHERATESSDKRKAFFAVPKNGQREICRGCEISFKMLTILDNVKGKHISCHFTLWLHTAHCILLAHICRGRYMLKRKEEEIIGNYEQLCVLYNIWSTGLKELFHFFLHLQNCTQIYFIQQSCELKTLLKSEVFRNEFVS